MSERALPRGTILRGKYRIERVLGEGGMGVVMLATHLKLDVHVAIKMLNASAEGKPTVHERFMREARAAAKLRSEHVVRVVDVDETERGVPFLVMEHLVGADLETLLRREGPLRAETAADYVLQACEGLAEAHALGIIHRDLKPANLFLAKDEDGGACVKVLDFGIAKALEGGGDLSLTATSGVVGSPLYMSPEQLKGGTDVDARTDIWALGVVLYQLASGGLPFEGTSATALAARIAADPPRPLSEVCPGLPDAYLHAVERCLRKDRSERFSSVVELARAIGELASAAGHGAERISRVVRAAIVRRASLAETLPGDLDLPSTPAEGAPQSARVTAAVTGEADPVPPLARIASAPPPPIGRTDYGSSLSSKELGRARSTRRTLFGVAAVGIVGLVVGFAALRARPSVKGAAAVETPSDASQPTAPPNAIETPARATESQIIARASAGGVDSAKDLRRPPSQSAPRATPSARPSASAAPPASAPRAAAPTASPLDFELK